MFRRMLFSVVLFTVIFPLTANGQSYEYRTPSSPALDSTIGWKRGYIEGYTHAPSVRQGDSLRFSISTLRAWIPRETPTQVQCGMHIYRVLAATAVGDEQMTASPYTFKATFYPLKDSLGHAIEPGDRSRRPKDYRRGANWPVATSIAVPANWPSGVYYAKVYFTDHTPDSVGYIPFVVRQAAGGSRSKILCVLAWNTWQAYNYWGGSSLYYDMGMPGFADTTVSFRRPFTNFFWDGYYVTTQLGQLDMRERQFIAWAENNGYPLEYCVDADVHAASDSSNFLDAYTMAVFPGHSEYWSRGQRASLESPQSGFKGNKGGNLLFLAANNCYWRINYYPLTPVTNNPDSMSCLKWASLGTPARFRNTVEHGDTLFEARIIGNQFMAVNDSNTSSIVDSALHWVFKGTGLNTGGRFGVGHTSSPPVVDPLAAGEADMAFTGRSPWNHKRLTHKLVGALDPTEPHYEELLTLTGDSLLYADMVYYEDTTSNARVFAAGGMGWSNCLYGDDAATMATITQNILDHFSGKKYIGNVYISLLEWNQGRLGRDTVEVDGNTTVLGGKQLRVGNSMKIVIDSAVVLQVNGELQIFAGAIATISGMENKAGNLVINSGGTLRVKSGATLTLQAPLHFVMETGANLVLESGATLKMNTMTVTGDSVVITVPANATLRLDSLAGISFGARSRINVTGTLVAQGTAAKPILLARSTSNNDYWSGITLNPTSNASLSYCDIHHAQVGINANALQPTVSHCTFDSCKIGISLFQSGGEITGSTCTHNNIKGIIIDGGDADVAPLITDNTVSSKTTGISITNASPVLERNTIADNTSYGIWCDDGGNPFISRNEPDILGKELMTLVNEDQRAGYHSTVFDASRFASGVYLYQLNAAGFVQTKKLLLLR